VARESAGEGPSTGGAEECRSGAMVLQRHDASVKVRHSGEDTRGRTWRLGLGVAASAYGRKETV
jgi:hypothetical protein